MNKICLRRVFKTVFSVGLFVTLALFLVQSSSFAASFSLNRIGALDTSGNLYPEWWYTATNPVFSGSASAGTKISVTAGESTTEVTADDQGSWSYASSLGVGDHTVTFVSDDGSYSFILHVGSNVPDFSTYSSTASVQTTGSTTTVPPTGSHQFYFFVLSVYLGILGYYFYKKHKAIRPVTTKEFEDKILRD